MELLRTYAHMRNDFRADYRCEHCGYEMYEKSGYSDANYFNKVIPNAICPKCKKNSKGETEEEAKINKGRNYYI